ncbi:hypothetical protein HMPREF0044_0756 [Gleimia coleocanis DSM 15436]|uniref:Bacterial sensory transduction regulator n=1 Tax=Gleimia coleocanis DSM 15436 TaxID=525245 RepID=C0W113_9ACTO|nr:YbjN domain-containing protein [Gleimia coleocanis]EEH63737.1 hypothetical protein HMPREF0044_0756 [Gleimia coleocanis DSM 15436]
MAKDKDLVYPLSKERLQALFEAEGYKYYVDSDGDLGGFWDFNTFHFVLAGENQELLHILCRSRRVLTMKYLDVVRAKIKEFNAEKIFPTCFYRISDEGLLTVHTQLTYDWEHGVSDSQLEMQLQCAVTTSRQFFEELEAALDA